MRKEWQLKRTKQCANCPWLIGSNPYEIPDYNVEHHKSLEQTIADPNSMEIGGSVKIMQCHGTKEAHCIGWLHNQLGVGNNVNLRFSMLGCTNCDKIELLGEQHKHFEDTFPNEFTSDKS